MRIGVFSGSFDPVHRGHVESCIVALGALTRDTVLILIEKKPQRKNDLAEYIDRANMLELAITDYPSLRLVDLEADNITTAKTLEYLNHNFPNGEYWYIVGPDMLGHITEWPGHDKLMETMNMCVVLRNNDELKNTNKRIEELKEDYQDTQFVVLPSVWSPVSSSTIKQSLNKDEIITGLDPTVREYIKRHGLYLQS